MFRVLVCGLYQYQVSSEFDLGFVAWRGPYHLFYVPYRLITFSGGTFLRGVQGNPNYFPILVQGDAVHGILTN